MRPRSLHTPNAEIAGEPRDAGLLGRETKCEVVLVSRLRAALEQLNPALPPEAITAAGDELSRARSVVSRFSEASFDLSPGLAQGERLGPGNHLTDDWTHT